MKKIILGSLALAVSSAFAVDVQNTVTGVASSALSAEQQIRNANGSCDATCAMTTTFPGTSTSSGTTLLSQAVNNTETQTIPCVAAGHPATWTGSATQTRSFKSQNGVRILGTETAWVTTANSCVAPVVTAIATCPSQNVSWGYKNTCYGTLPNTEVGKSVQIFSKHNASAAPVVGEAAWIHTAMSFTFAEYTCVSGNWVQIPSKTACIEIPYWEPSS